MSRTITLALLIALAGTNTAIASDFNGKIKRIKIKESSSTTNVYLPISVVTGSGSPSMGHTVTVDLKSEQGQIPVKFQKTGRLARHLDGSTTYSGLVGRAFLVQGSYLGWDGRQQGFSLQIPVCRNHCPWAEVDQPDGNLLRARVVLRNRGDLDVALQFHAPIKGDEGAADTLPHGPVAVAVTNPADPGRAAKVLLEGASDGESYETTWDFALVESKIPGDAGEVLARVAFWGPVGPGDPRFTPYDEQKSVLFLQAPPASIYQVESLPGRAVTRLEVLTFAPGASPAGTLEAEVEDARTGELLAAPESNEPEETVGILEARGLTFEKAPEGVLYKAEIVLYSGKEPVAVQSVLLAFNGKPWTGEVEPWEGSAAIRKIRTAPARDGSWTVDLSVEGDWAAAVDGAGIRLEATLGAPLPKTREAWASLAGQFLRWVLPFRNGTSGAEAYGVGLRWTDDVRGVLLDTIDFEIQANLGTGTRTTSTQASTKAELL